MLMDKIILIGSKELGLNVLKTIYALEPTSLIAVITLDDSQDNRSVLPQFISFCKDMCIDLIICKSKKEFDKNIHDLQPDLCIVACWYWIISKEVLESIPHGVIGIHYSYLPMYRGWAPVVWQMINGQDIIGLSVFYFTEEMDAGDILFQDYVTNLDNDYISDILEKLESLVLVWLRKNYHKLINGTINATPQSMIDVEPTYCARRYPFDGEIDWSKTASEIYNFIRAQSRPYPGAFTYYNGKKLTIWDSNLADIKYHGTPGQVAKTDKAGMWVICGDNKPIVLGTIHFSGKGDLHSSELFISMKTRLGRQ